jgi:hypothetical protein
MARIKPVLSVLPLIVLIGAAQSPNGAADLDLGTLASGPYSEMHMLLEKTIFNLDVLTVDVRFDPATQRRFQQLAAGQPFSDRLVSQIADAAINASEAFVKLEFKRDVSLNRWVQAVRESLRKGWQAGLIQEETYRHISNNLPQWFHAIAGRGFKTGDQILYRAYPDKMRTGLVSARGEVLVDQTDPGSSPKRALLSGYFAPGTDFREPLIRSLLDN